MKKGGSSMIWIGLVLIAIGALIDIFTTSYVVGTTLIVIGALLAALSAGKGRRKGGPEDH